MAIKKPKYLITKEDYPSKVFVWDAEVEVLIALLVNKLVKIRPNLNWNKTCNEILSKYVKKNKTSKVSPTKIMNQLKK